jgi:hypothetical protein
MLIAGLRRALLLCARAATDRSPVDAVAVTSTRPLSASPREAAAS